MRSLDGCGLFPAVFAMPSNLGRCEASTSYTEHGLALMEATDQLLGHWEPQVGPQGLQGIPFSQQRCSAWLSSSNRAENTLCEWVCKLLEGHAYTEATKQRFQSSPEASTHLCDGYKAFLHAVKSLSIPVLTLLLPGSHNVA